MRKQELIDWLKNQAKNAHHIDEVDVKSQLEDLRDQILGFLKEQTQPLCGRKACQLPLSDHYRIWNEPSTDEPRLYCIGCGKRIIEANPTLKFEIVQASASS